MTIITLDNPSGKTRDIEKSFNILLSEYAQAFPAFTNVYELVKPRIVLTMDLKYDTEENVIYQNLNFKVVFDHGQPENSIFLSEEIIALTYAQIVINRLGGSLNK